MCGASRRDAKAAIADHRGGDAMPGRDAEHAIPQDLRVVVGVHVDEAGRDNLARGVDRGCGWPIDLAQGHDLAVLDADVAREARLSGAVDDGAARDLQVEGHGVSWVYFLLLVAVIVTSGAGTGNADTVITSRRFAALAAKAA